MEDGLNFKIEGNNVKIATSQTVDLNEFVRRIAGIESQKKNFVTQKGFLENQIEEAKKNITTTEKNIAAATEDLEKAYHFLRLNHREDVIKQIEKKIRESEEKKSEETTTESVEPVHTEETTIDAQENTDEELVEVLEEVEKNI